jgi:hypothetical protein
MAQGSTFHRHAPSYLRHASIAIDQKGAVLNNI